MVPKAVNNENGPEYWASGFFLNSLGFLFWSGKVISQQQLSFKVGDFFHMLGFITLVYGAYLFTGNRFQDWQRYALGGLGFFWITVISVIPHQMTIFFFILMSLRAILFLWAGHMILRCVSTDSKIGRNLTGYSLIIWGIYVLFFPFIFRIPVLIPTAIGFLFGLHVLAGMGMVILVVDRIRIRAEKSETQIKRLEGLIPICASCKKIRDDHDSWHLLENYIQERSDATFSHGICPECSDNLYGKEDWYRKMKKERR